LYINLYFVGLILYNGQSSNGNGAGDFIAFGLEEGFPVFKFNLGSGPAFIKATQPVKTGQWHSVTLNRNEKNGNMIVDGLGPFVGVAPGRHQGLDLVAPLYLGGVPDFNKIHKLAGFTSGFVGK
jgi:dystroglycan 1